VIVTDPQARVQVVDGGGSVRVWLNDQHSVLVGTPLEAHDVADAFRKAANYLDERARLVANRLDRDAAVLLNEVNAELHREWGSTLTWAAPAQPITVIRACGCGKHQTCVECGDAA